MDVDHNPFPKNLTFLRESMCLSRQSLAEIIGSTPGHIAKLETGKTIEPSWNVVEKLARFFGVNSRTLINGKFLEIDRKEQAIKRAHDNFSEDQWDSIIDLVEGTTRRQAADGKFRNG